VSESPATGKGRPTPKRKDSQRRHSGPVAPPPTTRKEAAKRIRAQGAQKRKAIKVGSRSGDESAMMARDQGPVRRLVRDLVDSRRHPGVLLLPATFLPIIAPYVSSDKRLQAFAVSLWLTTVLITVFDLGVTGVLVRRRIAVDFPAETKRKGHIGYAVIRTAQFRRLRVPPPRVRPGDRV
jgi:hypothetical protein